MVFPFVRRRPIPDFSLRHARLLERSSLCRSDPPPSAPVRRGCTIDPVLPPGEALAGKRFFGARPLNDRGVQ